MLCQHSIATGGGAGPVDFDIAVAGTAVDGIGVSGSGGSRDREGKLSDGVIVQEPVEADGSAFPVGVNGEGYIDALIYLEGGGCLNRLSRIEIDGARHLWAIDILLARKCADGGCR